MQALCAERVSLIQSASLCFDCGGELNDAEVSDRNWFPRLLICCLLNDMKSFVLDCNKLDWSVYTCLTQLYDGRDMYINYYIKNKYMFRPFSLAIFRLRNEKILVNRYTRLVWVGYSGEVRSEVGKRSGMCCLGWLVWVQGFCYFCYV